MATKFSPILNNSNLYTLLALTVLTLAALINQGIADGASEGKSNLNKEDGIKALLVPEKISVGDTVLVKIAREKDSSPPKIFFQKSKIPVFPISDTWYRSLIPLSANSKSGKYHVEVFYKGKGKKIEFIVNETKYPLQELTLSKEVAALRASKIERTKVNDALSKVSTEKLWTSKFSFPSTGPLSTGYGVKRRTNGVIDPDYFHKGLDFAASQGSIITAPENGKVILAGNQRDGFVVNGNCIFLDHGHGVISGYLHLSSISVKNGDLVKKGQTIGKVGSSGIASGPHLHWGLYILGMTVDPIFWTSMIIE